MGEVTFCVLQCRVVARKYLPYTPLHHHYYQLTHPQLKHNQIINLLIN